MVQENYRFYWLSEGYDVTGVDLSSDMLAVAREKADRKGHSLFLVEQDMSELEGFGEFDLIGIFCDSLNYLQTEKEILQTFDRVYTHLNQSGLFLFDVHSINKMDSLFTDHTYAYNGEEISYIWQCFEGEEPNSVEHELTFFQLDHRTDQYGRYDELHFQRTFPIELYEKWLLNSGFKLLAVTADFDDKSLKKVLKEFFLQLKKNKIFKIREFKKGDFLKKVT